MARSKPQSRSVLLSILVALGGCDAIFAEDEPAPQPTAATVAPMPSPSEIVVAAPPSPSAAADVPAAPPWEIVLDAGADGGALGGDAGRPGDAGVGLDNAGIKNALYDRVMRGEATLDEIRVLKAACAQLGDKACRDQAHEALKKKTAE